MRVASLSIRRRFRHRMAIPSSSSCTFDHISHFCHKILIISTASLSKNHTLTQSSFANPCTRLSDDSLDSGFQFVAANSTTVPQYSFTMTNVPAGTPLWFYCRQADHCQKGMVFAVNPTADKTFQAFQQKAMSLGSVNPGNATTTNSSVAVPSGVAVTGSAGSATVSGSDATASPTASANSAYKVGATSAMMLSSIALVAGLIL